MTVTGCRHTLEWDGKIASGLYRWEDLRCSSVGINPPGAVSDPGRDATTGILLFSGTADNIVAGLEQMPHGRISGTPIRFHLHLAMATDNAARATRWKFEYKWYNVNGGVPSSYTDGTTTCTLVDKVGGLFISQIHPLVTIDGTGKNESSLIRYKLTRLANSDAADTHPEAVELEYIDLHYMAAGLGSLAEYGDG